MRIIISFFAILLLNACGTAHLDDYKGTLPELKLETFFEGKLKAYGMVFDRSGKLLRRFNVDLQADWQGNTGTIKEWFVFDDGEKSTRVWTINKIAENQYQGHASDVVGTAKGRTEGAALYWQYDMMIPVEGESYQVTLDDWMFLIDKQRLFNKTDMSKFGFKVGELILYIEKI